MEDELKTSRPVAAEDIRVGDYVTISHVTYELLPSECESYRRELEPRRITLISWEAGRPLKVADVCLPFVLVKDPAGHHVTLDLRRHKLAKLDEKYGKTAYRAIRGKKATE